MSVRPSSAPRRPGIDDRPRPRDLIISQAAQGLTDRSFLARFSGLALERSVEGGVPSTTTLPGQLDLLVKRLTPPNQDPTFELTVMNNQVNVLRFQVSWTVGTPLRVGAKFFGLSPDAPPGEIADAVLVADAAVLEPANALHTTAPALQVTGAVLSDSNFADIAAKLMFPPPPPPTAELIVRPTLDWVLFHRRRTRQCSPDIRRPAPGPTVGSRSIICRSRPPTRPRGSPTSSAPTTRPPSCVSASVRSTSCSSPGASPTW